MTAVSELARNIVQYARSGQIVLSPRSSPPGIEIVARDAGPGIADLDAIMDGRYRSKLGMGLGLRGVKKLAERFDVHTASGRGTTVSALLRTA
jgi:serine/threonine-protein kinase RsbT